MLDFNITAIIQVVNFFIAVVVLNYLLIRPVRNIIKQRGAKMGDLLTSTEAFARAADEKLANYQGSLNRARQEAAQARTDARTDALSQHQTLVADANKRAQEQLAQAKESLLLETQNARTALAEQVKPLAAKAVKRMLG
jgi:F-type H+-transporting ATPase subunit b